MHRHHLHSPYKRGFYSLALVAGILVLGTFGIHSLEHFSYVDSFFFTSMIATGQGPVGTLVPQTVAGKIFTAVLAYISVGTLLAALAFLFGPFLGKLWHIGRLKVEEEVALLSKKDRKQ